MNIRQFETWLRARSAPGAGIVGCEEGEVRALMRAQGVRQLPGDYQGFLRLAGRRAADFRDATEMFYPLLLQTKDWIVESIKACADPFQLPQRAFVFASHQGYNYWYFDDAEAEPPGVVNWIEGRRPERRFTTFSDWLGSEVQHYEAGHGGRPQL